MSDKDRERIMHKLYDKLLTLKFVSHFSKVMGQISLGGKALVQQPPEEL